MLIIRELTAADDFADAGSVYAESWKSAYAGIVPAHYLEKLNSDRWSGSIAADPASTLGAFLDGKLIGVSHVCFAREPEREGYGEIASLYLRPGYVGRGYGRKLALAALRKLKNDGCTDVCLWALQKNVRAEGFYQRLGFVKSGDTQTEPIGGEDLPLDEFVLSLEKMKL